MFQFVLLNWAIIINHYVKLLTTVEFMIFLILCQIFLFNSCLVLWGKKETISWFYDNQINIKFLLVISFSAIWYYKQIILLISTISYQSLQCIYIIVLLCNTMKLMCKWDKMTYWIFEWTHQRDLYSPFLYNDFLHLVVKSLYSCWDLSISVRVCVCVPIYLH